MRGVEAVAWRDDFASFEHASKHLLDKCMILICLHGKFFGAQWGGAGLQGFEEGLSLKGVVQVKGSAFKEGRGGDIVGAEPADGGDAVTVADDLVGEVAGFCTELIFRGGQDARVLVRGVLDDEQTGTGAGQGAERVTAAIEEGIAKAPLGVVVDD